MTVIAQEVFGARYELAERYEQILATKGIEWGLMGPRETDRLWDRHILNAVALSDLIPKGAIVGDVGSGAGLPGIPLAIKRPDLEMTLIEPLLRRYNFLRETIDELGLGDQVRVERLRAEDCDEVFDIVTCRAVAPLPKLLKWCRPCSSPMDSWWRSRAHPPRLRSRRRSASSPPPGCMPRCARSAHTPTRSRPRPSS